MKSYKIYLIRHGITEANLKGKYIGSTDLDLCEEGACEILELSQKYEYPNVGRVYSSPLKRALQTAKLIYPYHKPVAVNALKEYSFGEFENKTAEELLQNETYKKWLDGEDILPKGAENSKKFKERVVKGLDMIIRDMMKDGVSEAAVITHAGVITTILGSCGLPRRPSIEWSVESGRGYTLLVNAMLWGNNQAVEVFTPLPYGTGIEAVDLSYQKPFDEFYDDDGEEEE